MSDPIFADPRLAAVYDAFEGPRDDLDAYVTLADELSARCIVDLGCGTGTLALRLARPDRHIVGIDPARASLDVARAKPGAGQVSWIEGDAATTLPTATAAIDVGVGAGVDLVVMAGNTAQAVTGDHAWAELLHHVHTALVPGGCLVFETRRPQRRAWQDWTTTRPVTIDIPHLGAVEQHTEVLAVDLPLVTFRHTYRFHTDTTTAVSDSTIRFRGLDELHADLHRAGFDLREVREAPDRPGRELVLVAHPRARFTTARTR